MTTGDLITPRDPSHNRYGTVGRVRRVFWSSNYPCELVSVEIMNKSGLVIAVLVEPVEEWRPV